MCCANLAYGFVAAPFAADKMHGVFRVGAQRGKLHPMPHALLRRNFGQQSGRAVMHGFQHVCMAAHHADAVEHGIRAAQDFVCGSFVRLQVVKLAAGWGAQRVAVRVQDLGNTAADKTTCAEEDDVHA